MHPFVQIQVVMLRLCYISRLSDYIIGSVIERVSVYWHKVSFTSGSYSFLGAYFLTLLHHNHNLTSNHVVMFSCHIYIFNIHFHNSVQIFVLSPLRP